MSTTRFVVGIVLTAALLLAVGCNYDPAENVAADADGPPRAKPPEDEQSPEEGEVLPAAAERALRGATTLQLLSLDPLASEKEWLERDDDQLSYRLDRWIELGRTTITDAEVRTELVDRFKAGVETNHGDIPACFYPRHAIRAMYDGDWYEFIICFECNQVEWRIGDKEQAWILVTQSPQPTFDAVLQRAGVPLAAKPGG